MKRVYDNFLKDKKGISPVVATVLLIAMVVVLGLIIFMWFRGFTQEAVTKFDTNIEIVCNDVVFESSYSEGTLSIINTGNIPIHRMNIKSIGSGGSFSTREISVDSEEWKELGLNQGEAYSQERTFTSDINEIVLIPVLIGDSKVGQKTYDCNEALHGHSIKI